MKSTRVLLAKLLWLVVLIYPATAAAAAEDPTRSQAWAAFARGEAVVLMRHALAPGTGDPPDFKLGDCSTQRNLSDRGRQQAVTIGGVIRRYLTPAQQQQTNVFSSQWCRCQETASLLQLGPVQQLPPLNSFFARPTDQRERMDQLRRWLAEDRPAGPTVLVTHQVTISALVDLFPMSGEMVFIVPGEQQWRVLATVETDAVDSTGPLLQSTPSIVQ